MKSSDFGMSEKEGGRMLIFLASIVLNFISFFIPLPISASTAFVVVEQVQEHDFGAWMTPMKPTRHMTLKGK